MSLEDRVITGQKFANNIVNKFEMTPSAAGGTQPTQSNPLGISANSGAGPPSYQGGFP